MNAPAKALSQAEFVALLAMLTATTAFSIDAMLPALPRIAAELTPETPNRAQLILTVFLLGMGSGTLFTGVLSDRFGRKAVIIAGSVLYVLASALAYVAASLEVMLAARLIQGLGAAAPRVVAVAMIRDLYSGREMARIMSFIMLVFSLVPALAPAVGAIIIAYSGWHGIFLSFMLFGTVSAVWLGVRQPETLPVQKRRPVRFDALLVAARAILAHPTARLAMFGQTLTSGMIFGVLTSTQQVFDQTYGQGGNFPFWVAGIATFAATASLLNARLVVKLGMRLILKVTFAAQAFVSAVFLLILSAGVPNQIELLCYAFWTTTVFFQAGMTLGNLSALALEPMAHIAGSAASVVTAFATIGAVFIASAIGQSFNGTPQPLAIGILLCAAVAFWITTKIRRETDET